MKKQLQLVYPIDQPFDMEENKDFFHITNADSKADEIQPPFLKEARLNTHMARWFIDFEPNELLWSDGIYQILEIDPTKANASYATFLSIVHPQDRSIKERAQKALLNSKDQLEITYRLQMSDGRIKWIHEICSTNFDQSDNPIRSQGIVHDISSFKHTEEKFTQQIENLSKLINSLPVGILFYQNKKIIFINVAGIQLLGANDSNEIIGQQFTKFIHPNSLNDFQKRMKKMIPEMGPQTFESKFIQLNQGTFDAEIIAIPATSNDQPAIQLIVTDISKRKETEEALKKSKKKFQLLTIQLSDLIWTINAEGTITYISPFSENILGFKAETIIKEKITAYLTPASVTSCLNELMAIQLIVESGKKVEPRILILESIDRERNSNWIEVTSTIMYDAIHRFIGISGLARYISSRNEAEVSSHKFKGYNYKTQ